MRLPPLTFDSRSFLADGRRVFLIAGEQHYFRVPRNGWRDRLEKLKAAGANAVATYVPWLLHEPEEGRFDFSTPGMDVERFLDLCAEVGLWTIVRPGPYQYSELLNGGLPSWLLRDYPGIKACRVDGAPFSTKLSVSYLHPVFLEKVRRWFEVVVPRLASRQVGRGGAVAALQIDNELMGIHEWFGSWDYHPEALGIGREDGRWRDFLQARYGSLNALSDAWEIRVGSWSEARPIDKTRAGTRAGQRRFKDFHDFYFDACATYLGLLQDWVRESGIEVPVIHNSGGPGMNAYFEAAVNRLGKGFLLGSDHYYNLGLDWGDGTHPTPKYASKVFYSLEMLRHLGMPPCVLEMPGGSAVDFPPILGNDIECAYLTNLAYGMKGYNIYVHAGGYNPPGAGDPDSGMPVYDYGAAISPEGELRELYHVQKRVAALIHAHPWLPDARRVTDCRLGMVREYARAAHYGTGEPELGTSGYAAWTLMRKGLMMTSFCASLSPGMTAMEDDDWVHDTSTPLMMACADALDRRIQQRLVAFLDHGGQLLMAPGLPSLDQDFMPCSVLADYLGAEVAPLRKAAPAAVRRPAAMQPVLFDACTGAPLGWELLLASGGKVILLERKWVMGRRWDATLLREALERLRCEQVVDCSNPNVWTSLLSDGTHRMLFLMNFFTGPLTATARIRKPDRNWVDAGTHVVPGISVTVLDDASWPAS
jgi:beta-galactosidase